MLSSVQGLATYEPVELIWYLQVILDVRVYWMGNVTVTVEVVLSAEVVALAKEVEVKLLVMVRS